MRIILGDMILGIQGIGIDIMYLKWKYEIRNYDPDVVVFALHINDIIRAIPA